VNWCAEVRSGRDDNVDYAHRSRPESQWEPEDRYEPARAARPAAYRSPERLPFSSREDWPDRETRLERSAADQDMDVLDEGTTTLMLRNIPNRVRVQTVFERIRDLGFEDRIDFLYMPLDMYARQSKGYAFINFVDANAAADFARRVRGTKFGGRWSTKEAHVCTAAAQGIMANLRSITHSNWAKEEHMPLVLIEGKLIYITPAAAWQFLQSGATPRENSSK
jgi:hypothetical protein